MHLHDHVVWWIGPDKRILVSIDEGAVEWKVNEDGFHLDKETGALTLIQLHKNDSGRYGCEIINGHSSTSKFQLLVVGKHAGDMSLYVTFSIKMILTQTITFILPGARQEKEIRFPHGSSYTWLYVMGALWASVGLHEKTTGREL